MCSLGEQGANHGRLGMGLECLGRFALLLHLGIFSLEADQVGAQMDIGQGADLTAASFSNLELKVINAVKIVALPLLVLCL